MRHSLNSQSIIYHLQLWKCWSWTQSMVCQWVHHFSALRSCCSTVSIITITIIFKDKTFASVHSYLLQFARCWWHFCCHAVVVKTGLQAHTMGRPGAAHVPAGWPGPVSSYSAIVNILGDGREVSLTVILRGYLYRKYQLEGDEVTNQSSTFSSQYVKWRYALPPKTGDNKFSVIFLAVVTVRVD